MGDEMEQTRISVSWSFPLVFKGVQHVKFSDLITS